MSDETTLLPCPFCGGEAHISDDYSSKRGMVYSVWHDCPAGGGYHPYGQGVGVLQVTSAWFSSREEAIAAWNTRATHGTLTAEQVMAIAGKHQPDYCSDTHVCFDWQAIADELNALLGSGTCHMDFIDEYERPSGEEDYLCECSECGSQTWEPAHDLPLYCRKCGKAVS